MVIFYGLFCLWFARDMTPNLYPGYGLEGTLHHRIVTFSEPTIMQYRWFVPMIAEGIRQVTGLSERRSHMLLAALTMWLLLISFHMLLRRRFSPGASFAGGLILLMAYVVVIPSRYFHPYDILCTWCVVVAVEGILRRSVPVYVAALTLLCLTKWVAAPIAVIFLAPAWFDRSVSRSLRWPAILGSVAAVALVLGCIHIPLIGIDRYAADVTGPGYARISHAEFIGRLLDPRMFAQCVIYLLPAVIGVVWGYRAMDRTWRRLLWYPAGILLCGLAAKVVLWETRTYFAGWVVFIPYLLAALFRQSAPEQQSRGTGLTDEATAERTKPSEVDSRGQDSV